MAIPGSFIDELVSRTDIVGLVAGYVRLSKKSGGNMFGLCPFHSEKTPSFSVSADKQIYHCFGCGKGGGAINFMMEIENVPFRDAIEVLAARANMTVPEDSGAEDTSAKRRRMLELNRDAAKHFHEMLNAPIGQNAAGYLAARGIPKSMVTKFGIGAAPDSWSLLLDAMTAKGYSRQELIEAGLVRSSKDKGGVYDVFRNRLMFPVIDVRGGVIGFSGRILGEGEPKYLNSPDTLVFNKSRNLFGLNLAKKSKSGMLILAEGNIDVVTLHHAGFDCAVASLGTALTAEQVRLMSRYSDNVVIAYDSDEAGRKASERAISLLEKTGMSLKIVSMGDAKDPDEFLRKNGADAFQLLIDGSENHIEYRLMLIKRKSDLESDEGRLKYLAEATDLLSELSNAPEREIYSARVAETAGVSSAAVDNEVGKAIKQKKTKQKRDFERQVTRPAAAMQPADRTLRYDNEYSAAAEEGLVRCLISDPSHIKIADSAGFSAAEFTSPFLAKAFNSLKDRLANSRDVSASLILSDMETNEAARLIAILEKPDDVSQGYTTVSNCIDRIRTEKYKAVAPGEDLLMEIKKYREMKDTAAE